MAFFSLRCSIMYGNGRGHRCAFGARKNKSTVCLSVKICPETIRISAGIIETEHSLNLLFSQVIIQCDCGACLDEHGYDSLTCKYGIRADV